MHIFAATALLAAPLLSVDASTIAACPSSASTWSLSLPCLLGTNGTVLAIGGDLLNVTLDMSSQAIDVVASFPGPARSLDLSNNNIQALPPFDDAVNLIQLNLSYNALDPRWHDVYIPATIAILDLSYNARGLDFNRMTLLADSDLTELYFRGNMLTSVSLVQWSAPHLGVLYGMHPLSVSDDHRDLSDNPNLVLTVDADSLAYLSRPNVTLRASTNASLTAIHCKNGVLQRVHGATVCLVPSAANTNGDKQYSGHRDQGPHDAIRAAMIAVLVVACLLTATGIFLLKKHWAQRRFDMDEPMTPRDTLTSSICSDDELKKPPKFQKSVSPPPAARHAVV
ncbi:Aste57867_19769 [Aphanomyces stellatus]|uniref:Aste57867_19769 protein n=1 Tax=Aphanomyces stellatus TaxID=120398 RepID=A0A485LE13_9STRA|nr:hypothetical protein As57867_019704 [Aphanomyces stellatus]VFT96467.1 Aste57867_19769 [Aphanomyces stellatus]